MMWNMKFNNCKMVIIQIWNWGWIYYGLFINNCGVGFDFFVGGLSNINVGFVIFFDSIFSNILVVIKMVWIFFVNFLIGGSFVIENI